MEDILCVGGTTNKTSLTTKDKASRILAFTLVFLLMQCDHLPHTPMAVYSPL